MTTVNPMPETTRLTAARPSQKGASMIELLVAILIFAFGLLGLAGLQTKTLAYSQTSLYRSQAAALTDDLLDRMRVDRANARAGNWNSTATTPLADYTDWLSEVTTALPSGAATVAVVVPVAGASAPDPSQGSVTITITWDESRANSSSPASSTPASGVAASTARFTTVSQL
jgi:type IV pilus assembly protein PilV